MYSYFSYNSGTGIIPDDHFRISPSQISRFFDNTSQWYSEMLSGEAPAFTGSTASELGNCIHTAANMYFNTKSVDKAAILAYINSLPADIDKDLIRSQLKPMIDTLINQFLMKTKATHAELFVHTQIIPGVSVGGSVDLFDSGEEYFCDDIGLAYLKENGFIQSTV